MGDAPGVDIAVQKYLSDKGYKNVCVFCMGNICRNNVGNWETRHITATNGHKGADYYGLKDLEMANATDYGFMIWDGKSKGTLNNMRNLLKQNKKILVYFYPQREFFNILTFDNLENLLAKCDGKVVDVVDQKVKVDMLSHTLWPETQLLGAKAQLADPLGGVWANDPTLEPIFAEIAQQRQLTMPREVTFGATS